MLAPEDSLQALSWSSDSLYIAVSCSDRAGVRIVCPAESEWVGTVSEGSAGLQGFQWVPGQHCVVTHPDFALHTSVWHLNSGSSQALLGAKAPDGCLAFASADAAAAAEGEESPELRGAAQWAALLSREQGKDILSWFDTSRSATEASAGVSEPLWTAVGEPVQLGTRDAARLVMAPNGHSVWVLDDPMSAYAEEWTLEGICTRRLSLSVSGLGIVSATAHLSPVGGLLVLPTHSGPVHVINALSYETTLIANSTIASQALDCSATDVFVEVPASLSDADCSALTVPADDAARAAKQGPVGLAAWRKQTAETASSPDSRFVFCSVPVQPVQLLPSAINEVSPPRLGAIQHCQTSANEAYLACVCASRPSTVCIYDTAGGADAQPTAALCLRGAVTCVAWAPAASRLLIATASANVLVWEPGRAYAIQSQMGGEQTAVVRRITPPPAPGAPWLMSSRGRWCTALEAGSAAAVPDAPNSQEDGVEDS